MIGIQTSLETLLSDCRDRGLLDGPPAVDFTLGIPGGVFVIARSEDHHIRNDMRYLKMGEGPFYVFFSPYVMCHYDAVPSIAGVVLTGHPVISPDAGMVTEVAAFAKRDLSGTHKLDGIGRYDCYGLLTEAGGSGAGNLLPVGLCEFARLNRNIDKDEPIELKDVEWTEDNELLRLWRQQREVTNRKAKRDGSLPSKVPLILRS